MLAHYGSSEEEHVAGGPGKSNGQAPKASSQPAPGWLNPTPGSEAEKKDKKPWPEWTMTRPSASGIAHTPAHRRTMTSSASAMAVAQALAKAAESAAVATKRAADVLHKAGEHMGQQGSQVLRSDKAPSTSDTGTAAVGQRGRGGGRGGRGAGGGRGSQILRSEDGQSTPKVAKKAIVPAHDTPSPNGGRHRDDDAASGVASEEEEPEPDPEKDVPTEEYDEFGLEESTTSSAFPAAGSSSALPAAGSKATAGELAAIAAHQAHQKHLERQAEAKAKQETKAAAKSKKEKGSQVPRSEADDEAKAAAATTRPKTKAEPAEVRAEFRAPAEANPPMPCAFALPATFAGRHPPKNPVAAARFRSEQSRWFSVRQMWFDEGLEDTMNTQDSQRSFWGYMRMHTQLSDKEYDSKIDGAWMTWKTDHVVRPRKQIVS